MMSKISFQMNEIIIKLLSIEYFHYINKITFHI